VIATVIDRAGDQLGTALPRVAAALLLLVAGLLLAALLGRLVRRALIRLGLDRMTERWRLPEILERAGLGRSLARLVGLAVRLSLAAIVIFAALSLLGLEFLSQSLNEAVLFIPRLIIALVLLLVGVVLGALARDRVERGSIQMDLPIALGPLVQVVVVVLFGLTAANEVGIAIAPLLTIVLIALLAVGGTLAIAFGLGGREVARSLSAARYARADFSVGETIRVDDLRGTIVRIDSAATTLRAGNEMVRVPNSVLVERIVVRETEDV
jgi:small-conductance mechanosensitive channel